MCALEGEDDLSDFMIEIDILAECKHPNVVELHEAYFLEGKLWVSFSSYLLIHSIVYYSCTEAIQLTVCLDYQKNNYSYHLINA